MAQYSAQFMRQNDTEFFCAFEVNSSFSLAVQRSRAIEIPERKTSMPGLKPFDRPLLRERLPGLDCWRAFEAANSLVEGCPMILGGCATYK